MRIIKKFNLVTLSIVALLTLFCCTSIHADDTNLGRTPNGVFPMQENDVVMESEEITVDLEKNSAECIFIFHNTGKSKNVYMGFPGKLYHEEDGLTNDANLQLSNFKTFVKGEELPITREKGALQNNAETSETSENLDISDISDTKYSEFFTFTVPFKENEKITVQNTYNFTPTNDSIGDVFSGYVLKTGAMWKGPIGSAKVTFKLGKIQPYQIERLQPGGLRFEGNKLVWERNNFEPTYDLSLVYNTYHYSDEFLKGDYVTIDQVSEVNQKIDIYNNVKELANKGEIDKLITLYNKAVNEKDSILALYIKSYLPSDNLSEDVTSENQTEPSMSVATATSSELNLQPGGPLIEAANESASATVNKSADGTANESANESEDGTVNSSAISSVTETANELANSSVDESVRKSVDGSVNEPGNELLKSQKSNDSKLIVWVVSGIILFGLLVVSVVISRKKRNS